MDKETIYTFDYYLTDELEKAAKRRAGDKYDNNPLDWLDHACYGHTRKFRTLDAAIEDARELIALDKEKDGKMLFWGDFAIFAYDRWKVMDSDMFLGFRWDEDDCELVCEVSYDGEVHNYMEEGE